MFVITFLALCAMAALVSAAPDSPHPPELLSPCPELFSYDAPSSGEHNRGRWVGRLTVRSPEDLRGIWIRLIFDGELIGVAVDGFESVVSEDRREVLIKNRQEILLANSPKIIRLNVVYDERSSGNRIPKLVEYRLNARTVCPDPKTNRSDLFLDDSSQDFVSHLQSHINPSPAEPPFECGETPAAPHQPHPWAASLYIRQADRDKYACAATLIGPSHVITAAHCVTFRNDSTPIPGSMARVHLKEYEGIDAGRLVAQVIVKPGYQAGYLRDDVAILRLAAPVASNGLIAPVCVSGVSRKEPGRAVLVGHVGAQGGGRGGELLEADASRISEAECVASNPQLRGILDDGSYCLSYGSGNVQCVGNSGDSYISIHNNRAILKGIVTLGVRLQNGNECNQNSVAIVADVEKHLNWIRRVIY